MGIASGAYRMVRQIHKLSVLSLALCMHQNFSDSLVPCSRFVMYYNTGRSRSHTFCDCMHRLLVIYTLPCMHNSTAVDVPTASCIRNMLLSMSSLASHYCNTCSVELCLVDQVTHDLPRARQLLLLLQLRVWLATACDTAAFAMSPKGARWGD